MNLVTLDGSVAQGCAIIGTTAQHNSWLLWRFLLRGARFEPGWAEPG